MFHKKVGIALAAEVIEFASDMPLQPPAAGGDEKRGMRLKGITHVLERPPSGAPSSGGDTDEEMLSGGEALDAVRDALGSVTSASMASGWWKKTRKGKGGRFLGDSKVSQTIMSTLAVGKFLRKHRVKVCDPALTEACASGLIAEVCRLMDVTNPALSDKDGEYALTAALKNGQWGVVELLLECEAIDVNAPDANKVAPILLCIMHSRKNNQHGSSAKCLQQLVNRGAEIDVVDSDGCGLVELALLFGQTEIASFLISECIRRRQAGEGGGCKVESTLLFVVSELEEDKAETCFRRLLEYGVDVNFTDDVHAATPLARLLAQGKTLLATILLEAGADPNSSGAASRGSETWGLAVRVKKARVREQMLLALVRHGLEVHAPFVHGKDLDWVLPLTYAIKTESLPLFRALLEAGADPNTCLVDRACALWRHSNSAKLAQLSHVDDHFLPPLCLAMQQQADTIWGQLLHSPDVDLNFVWRYDPAAHSDLFSRRPPSPSPLAYVAALGDLPRLEQLLERCSAEAIRANASTALAKAAEKDHAECCRRLLEEAAVVKSSETVFEAVRIACEKGARHSLRGILHALGHATAPLKPLPSPNVAPTDRQPPPPSATDEAKRRPRRLDMLSPIGAPLRAEPAPTPASDDDELGRLASSGSLAVAALVQDRQCVWAAARNGHALVVRSLLRALPAPCSSGAMEVWGEAVLAAVEAEEWDTVREVVEAQGSVLPHPATTRTEQLAAFMTRCAHWEKHAALAGLDRMRHPEQRTYEWDSSKQMVLEAMLDPQRGETVDVDHTTHEGNTVLHQAVARGWAGVVECLLRAGARGDIPDEDGNTAVALAAMHEEEELLLRLVRHFRVLNVKLVERNQHHHAVQDDLLSRCIKQGWLAIATLLIGNLERHVDQHTRRARGEGFSRVGSSTQVQREGSLVSFGARRRSSVVSLEEAFSPSAAASSDPIVRRSLEPAPRQPSLDDRSFKTAVQHAMREAAARGWEEGVSRLMQLSDPEAVVVDDNKTLPTLAMAALNGSAPCVELLLGKDAEGLSLAIVACSIRGQQDTLAMLLRGCALNKFALERLSHDKQLRAMEAKNVLDLALCLACLRGSVPCVQLLAEATADVNCVLNVEEEVRRWCSQEALIADMLPREHPDLDDPQMQQLYAAYLAGTWLLSGAESGTRPLLVAASLGFTGVVQALLEHGADTSVVVPETQGMTALALASMFGHHNAVVVLLRYGAYVDAGKEDMIHLIQFCRVRDMWKKVLEGLSRTEQVSYGTAFDESFVPPLPSLQPDSGGKYAAGVWSNTRPIQVTPLLWSLMAKTEACSKLLVEAGAGKDLVHAFVGSEAFVQYSAHNKPHAQARAIQQELVGECADYKYYGPFQATLEANKQAGQGEVARRKSDDRFRELHGSVAAHRRVQAVAVDVGWHDRALKEVKFLTGMSKSQLEDAYIWQGRPRSGTTFFMVLRADEFVEGVDLAIGDESVLAIRILVQSSRHQARASPWYGEPVGSGISSLERNLTVRPHGRELAGCKIVTGPAVGDVQVVKEIAFWARWRTPYFAMRSLHPEAQREPFKSEWEQDGRGLLSALDSRITDLIAPHHDKATLKHASAPHNHNHHTDRPASAPPAATDHRDSAVDASRQAPPRSASGKLRHSESGASPTKAVTLTPTAGKTVRRRRKRPASAGPAAQAAGTPKAVGRFLDDATVPMLLRSPPAMVSTPKTPPLSSMQTRALIDLHRHPSKQQFRRAGDSTLFMPIGNSRRREKQNADNDKDIWAALGDGEGPAESRRVGDVGRGRQTEGTASPPSRLLSMPKAYSSSESLARVWRNTPVAADDPLAADGKIEGAKKLRRPGTIMQSPPQPKTQHVARPLMPEFSPVRRSLDVRDLSLSPGLSGSTRGLAGGVQRMDAEEIAAQARESRAQVCARMGEMLQRELTPEVKGHLPRELTAKRPLSMHFLCS